MQNKPFKTLFLLLALLLLVSACSPRPTPVPQPTLGIAATDTPVQGLPPAQACPPANTDSNLLSNSLDGYCLLYPAGDAVISPLLIVINPTNAPGDTPGDAWMQITMEAAANRTAAQVADGQIAAAGQGFNITRSEIQVDGKPAVVVDGLPGPDPWRKVFIVGNDRLYTFSFLPWVPDPSAPTPLEKLYSSVIGTLHFMPPAQPLPTPSSP